MAKYTSEVLAPADNIVQYNDTAIDLNTMKPAKRKYTGAAASKLTPEQKWDIVKQSMMIPYEQMTLPQRTKFQQDAEKFVYGEDEYDKRQYENRRANAYARPKPGTRQALLSKRMTHKLPEDTLSEVEVKMQSRGEEIPTPGTKPTGTYNPLVHTGRNITGLSSGVKQLLNKWGLADEPDDPLVRFTPWDAQTKEDEKQIAEDFNLFDNQYDQPLVGQVGGVALDMVPYMAGAPVAMGLKGIVNRMLGKEAVTSNLGQQALARQGRALPFNIVGVKGATDAGTRGFAEFVDPNTENEWETRTGRGLMSGVLGGIGDAAGFLKAKRYGDKLSDTLREQYSKDLPVNVRLPASSLYPGQRSMRNRFWNTIREEPGTPVKNNAAGMMQTALGDSLSDILENNRILYNRITGRDEYVPRGEMYRRPLADLVERRQVMEREVDDLFNNTQNITGFAPNKISDESRSLEDVYDEFISMAERKYGYKWDDREIASLRKNLEGLTKDAIVSDDATKVAANAALKNEGLENAGDVVDLNKVYTTLKYLLRKSDDMRGKTSGRLARDAYDLLNDWLVQGKDYYVGKDAGKFADMIDRYKVFKDNFKRNKLINRITSGELSPHELSAHLFSERGIKSNADQRELIDYFLTQPGFKGAMRGDAWQQLTSDYKDKMGFDPDALIKNYSDAVENAAGIDSLTKLFDFNEIKQLGNLKNVTRRLVNKDLYDLESLQRTNPLTQTLTTDPNAASYLPDFFGIDAWTDAIRQARGRQGPVYGIRGMGIPSSQLGITTYDEGGQNLNPFDNSANLTENLMDYLGL